MFIWPVPGLYWIYSDYYDPRDYGMHVSIDVAPYPNSPDWQDYPPHPPIVAIAPGRVIFAGWASNAGRSVWLDLPDGWRVHYCHLSAFNVAVGQTVEAGDVIGLMGGSGYGVDAYWGEHLHLTLLSPQRPAEGPSKWIDFAGKYAVDPELYLFPPKEDDMALTAEQGEMLKNINHWTQVVIPKLLADNDERAQQRYEQLQRDIAAVGTGGGASLAQVKDAIKQAIRELVREG